MVDGPESQSPLDEQAGGITRRQALKRGAVLGGALVWATPVVQVIGMKPAFAQTVSPACRITVVIEFGDVEVTLCLEGPAELCECVLSCPDGDSDCVGQCIISNPPDDFSVGPCLP
jgi:hypothetical protein